jgi:hypothetical protein
MVADMAEAPQAAPPPPASGDRNDDSGASGAIYEESYMSVTSIASEGGSMPITAPVTEGLAEKIIYSVNASIETIRFDETIENVYRLMESHGAFIEHSNVSGVNYAASVYGWHPYRYASFTLRVPRERLNAMSASLESLGHVVNFGSSAMNITSQFFDTQSRLSALTVEEERLLDMLRRADEVPDLIAIEERLSNVRYQIESLTTTLNNWQRQVDYSTMTLHINEVEEYTEVTPTHRTYWERIGDGLMASVRGVGRFFTDLFAWLIINLPVLLTLAAIVVAIIFVLRKKLRSVKNKIIKKPEGTEPEEK